MQKLLTVTEAAEFLSISAKHFRREFIDTGAVSVVALGKSSKGDRIEPGEIEALSKKQRQKKCNIKEAVSGGSRLKLAVKKYDDPLGLPRSVKRKNLNAGLGTR